MSSKKVLTAINIICFIIFVLIQSLIFFLKILDYSLDGSRNGIDDVIFYIGTYLLTSIIYLIGYALIASFCGIVSSWIGFKKKSVIATIVASCIIMVIMCQIAAMTFFAGAAMLLLLTGMGIVTFFAVKNMLDQVQKWRFSVTMAVSFSQKNGWPLDTHASVR